MGYESLVSLVMNPPKESCDESGDESCDECSLKILQ